MIRRRLAGVAGLAASVSIASLVLAENLSTGQGHPRAAPALFIAFLVSMFTLLGVAIVDADHATARLSEIHETSPRWSLRAAQRRLGARLARVTRNGLTKGARTAHAAVTGVVETSRSGLARLRRELEPERRRTLRARLKKGWYDALVVMGMPPEGLDANPTPPGAPTSAGEPSEQGAAQLRAGFAALRRRADPLPTRPRPLLKSRRTRNKRSDAWVRPNPLRDPRAR